MVQSQILPAQYVLDRYNIAAAEVAVCVDVMDRLDNDPTYPGDRSPEAVAHRARMFAAALAVFRDAKDALLTAGDRELRRPVGVTAPGEVLEP